MQNETKRSHKPTLTPDEALAILVKSRYKGEFDKNMKRYLAAKRRVAQGK